MALTISQTVIAVTTAIQSGLVPFIKGAPGLGKSDMAKSIAANRDLHVIDIRLSQCDPTDLNVA